MKDGIGVIVEPGKVQSSIESSNGCGMGKNGYVC